MVRRSHSLQLESLERVWLNALDDFLTKNIFCEKINDKNCFQDFLWDLKWNEIYALHKEDSVYITLHWERNEIKFCVGGSSREKTNAAKTNHFCYKIWNKRLCKWYLMSTHSIILHQKKKNSFIPIKKTVMK